MANRKVAALLRQAGWIITDKRVEHNLQSPSRNSRIPQSICGAVCRTPAPLTAEAALDQAGQEFGAIMLTENLTLAGLPLGRLTGDKR